MPMGITLREKIMSSKLINISITALSVLFLCFVDAKAGENIWTSNGPPGGSVWTFTFHPLNHSIIFCGTVQNGIYKSTNAGSSWEHLPLGNLYGTIRVIQIHPTGPDTMYAGTAHGIFKSTDAGITWILLQPPSQVRNDYMAFIMHPVHANIIFGGMINGFRSTDGGDTWRDLALPPLTDMCRIAIDPVNTNNIYFVGGSMPIGNGVWKSSDLGETWFSIQNNLDSTGYGNDIAIDSDNPNILYVAKDNNGGGGSTCLSKSTNGGQSWFDITPQGLSIPAIIRVRISHFDHQRLYIVTLSDGVWRSTDGGATWQPKNRGLRILMAANLEIDPVDGTLFLGVYDDGAYKSTDGGDNWDPISDNINVSWSHDLAISPFEPAKICAAMNNGLFHSNDMGENWEYLNMGSLESPLVMSVLFDKYLRNYIYVCGYDDRIPGLPRGFWRSTDNGTSWDQYNNGLPSDIYYWNLDVSYLDSTNRRIFLMSSNGLYFSDNLGESWEICQNGLPPNRSYGSIAVAPSDNNLIVLGSNPIYISTNRGDSWNTLAPLPVPANTSIYDIKIHPFDPSHIYITTCNPGSSTADFLETTDLGQTWTSKLNNLPVEPPYPWDSYLLGIKINPQNPDNIFISSCGLGIYQTHNNGLHWEPFNAGLESDRDSEYVFGNIYFSPGDTTRLFIATHQRGIWSVHRTSDGIIEHDNMPKEVCLMSYPNPFNAQTTIGYTMPRAGEVDLSIYNIIGQKIITIFDSPKTAGRYEIKWDASDCSSGLYYAKLKTLNHEKTIKLILLK
jgi:photosystem II stability/assembly factor-like uncharacterized protein